MNPTKTAQHKRHRFIHNADIITGVALVAFDYFFGSEKIVASGLSWLLYRGVQKMAGFLQRQAKKPHSQAALDERFPAKPQPVSQKGGYTPSATERSFMRNLNKLFK